MAAPQNPAHQAKAHPNKVRLGELLVESGILSQDQLAYALADQRHGSERIGETLLRLGYLERPQLWAALAEQHVRRFVGALGITALAFHPGLALAGNVRSQMLVSVTAASTATTDIRMVGAGAPGAGAASISLACNASGMRASASSTAVSSRSPPAPRWAPRHRRPPMS